MTPDVFDMERILRFLRPICEGGMGGGSEGWIAYCLGLQPERARAAFDALLAQRKLIKWPDGTLRVA